MTFKLLQYSFIAKLDTFYLLVLSVLVFIFIKLFFDKKRTIDLLIIVFFVSSASLISNYLTQNENINDIEYEITNDHNNFIDQLSSIKLKSKPNIYLIGFDSMTSKSWQKKYFGYEESYIETLDKYYESYSGFNLYVPTLHALNALMRLDQDEKIYGPLMPTLGLVNGKYRSPLLYLMKSNGYTTNFYYYDTYFGEKGRYLDNLYINEKQILTHTALCQSSNSIQRKFFLMGACNEDTLIDGIMGYTGPGVDIYEWPKITISLAIDRSIKSGNPNINILFFYRPIGHVPSAFDYNNEQQLVDYKKFYSRHSVIARELLEKIRNKILSKDPKALVVVFGDHGPYLSKGVDCSKQENKTFCIHNTYAANVSVLKTNNRCSSEYKSFIRGNVITPSEIVFSKLSCLSKNPVLLRQQIKYRNSSETKPGFFENLDNYLY